MRAAAILSVLSLSAAPALIFLEFLSLVAGCLLSWRFRLTDSVSHSAILVHTVSFLATLVLVKLSD